MDTEPREGPRDDAPHAAPASPGDAPRNAAPPATDTAADPPAAADAPAPLPTAPTALPARGLHGGPGALPGWLAERPPAIEELPRARLAAQTRRDFLLFAAGIASTATLAWWLLPPGKRRLLFPGSHDRLDTLAARAGLTPERRRALYGRVLGFDDDVAEALYSKDRRVRTYDRADAGPIRNNYNGATPKAGYVAGWRLALSGLASGRDESLAIGDLLARFRHVDQVTRLCCVEGWSAVAWWGGLRFAELLAAFPPAPGARWAALRSEVNLDARGNPDPYYVSIDLATAAHPQALLVTHHDGRPLTVEHGAPLRLLVPMKLGLKNIKAVTSIRYTADEPPDYWNERGYSKYDGL